MWIYLVIYDQLHIVFYFCRMIVFQFQYPNWPIYPFYNLLKIMYNRDTRLFYKYSGVEGELL
ncbi:hypothetical protein BAAL111456_16860 [Bacillus albus]